MNRVSGTYNRGKVALDQPVDWPDGVRVDVLCETGTKDRGIDVCVDGSTWEDPPEARSRWMQWLNSLKPVFAGDELTRFEADLRAFPRLSADLSHARTKARRHRKRGHHLHHLGF